MSRQYDVLFCKIAVTAGMVDANKAQRVLAICNKKEQETGRRPMVGAVFTKYQLLSPEQVRKVNEAVTKRTGGAVTAPAVRPKSARGADDSGRRRKGRRGARSKKPLDQRLLATGGAFGVVFLCVLGVIVYLVLVSPGSGDGSNAAFTRASIATGSSPSLSLEEEEEGSFESELLDELPAGVQRDLDLLFQDVLADRIDNPDRAKRGYEELKRQLADREKDGYRIPLELRERVNAAADGLGVAASGRKTAGGDLDDVFDDLGNDDEAEDADLDELEEE